MITCETGATTSSAQQSTATTICKFFNRAKGCRFGDKCRYKHEQGSKEPSPKNDVKTEKNSDGQKFPGKKSEVSKENSENSASNIDPSVVTLPEKQHNDQRKAGPIPVKKRQIRRPICRYFIKSGYCRDGEKCRFLHKTNVPKSKQNLDNDHKVSPLQIPSVDSKITSNSVVAKKLDNFGPPKRPENLSEKLSGLTDEGVKFLQAVEIEQLKKRFGNDVTITQEDHGTVCIFNMKPSDPDWPYDVSEIQLNVTFPKDYPKKIFKGEVIDDDGEFPANFTEYINSDIEKHLKEHEEAQKLRDSPDLLFRPFLRWLDRNLENLFTKALKQIKFDVEARSAGLEFIAFDNKESKNKTDDESEETEAQKLEISNLEIKEDKELGLDEVTSESGVLKIGDGDRPGSDGGDDGGHDGGHDHDKEVSEESDNTAMFAMIEARKSVNLKKGTEVRFRGMELHENTATVRVTSLTFTVQCVRCKNRDEMPNVKENTQVVLTCSKCSNAQRIVFTSSEIMHQHSATMGYINPQGCLPIDLILSECQLVLGCLHCSKETSIKGINYGSTTNVWCSHCHNKLDMKVESARFHQLQPANISDDKIKTVQLKKSEKNKDPPIKSGQALPENGTCKHYKKSYRWMRFPCCGKCYPCDKCHEEGGDDHEMEQATRMICGFCAKEQTFSQKGCISCKSFVTAVHTSHWEGGKGCRSKIKMSRGDNKKYSDKSKTVSRHAEKVDGQKKK